MESKSAISARKIALIGIMAATLTVVKMALSFVANVELVSLLIAVYTVTFGWVTIIAVCVFVYVETLIWGTGMWVVSYFFYWNLLSLTFLIYKMSGIYNIWVTMTLIALMTFLFGHITAFFEIAYSGFSNFWYRYNKYYLVGVWFYFRHIVSNIVIFICLYIPVKRQLERFKQ